jgi:hypothetical protein
LSLPDEEETRSEFVSSQDCGDRPGHGEGENPPGAHDDIVTAVGMVVADLTERTEGRGLITSAVGRTIAPRSDSDARPTLPWASRVRSAACDGPRAFPEARC